MAMSLRIYGMGRALRGTFMSGRKGGRQLQHWTKVNNIRNRVVPKICIDTVYVLSWIKSAKTTHNLRKPLKMYVSSSLWKQVPIHVLSEINFLHTTKHQILEETVTEDPLKLIAYM